MGGAFQQLREESRAALHAEMARDALYLVENPAYVSPTDTPTEDPYISTPCTVRISYGFNQMGDMKGTNFHFAQHEEVNPKAIFLRAEIAAPVRGAIISIVDGEAYRVDHTLPFDGITVTADCLRLTASEATGLPLPG